MVGPGQVFETLATAAAPEEQGASIYFLGAGVSVILQRNGVTEDATDMIIMDDSSPDGHINSAGLTFDRNGLTVPHDLSEEARQKSLDDLAAIADAISLTKPERSRRMTWDVLLSDAYRKRPVEGVNPEAIRTIIQSLVEISS